jgi:uncharacterized glyoxalase superfamily protein PhnB
MIDATHKLGSAVIPVIRYRNLPAAIDWLCAAFGFEKHRIALDNNGAFLFAQLRFGSALIMLSPVRASAFDKLMRQPDEVGGAETQVCYFFVRDAKAHCVRARAAGAEIVFDVEDRVGGGRSYSCRDLEGHLWNFGTYNPWHQPSIGHGPRNARRGLAGVLGIGSLLAAGLLAVMAVMTVLASRVSDPGYRDPMPGIETGSIKGAEDPGQKRERLARRQAANAQAEQATTAAEHRLAMALREMDELRKIATEAQTKKSQAMKEKETAEQLVKELHERLYKAWADKNAAQHAAKEARRQLAAERTARRGAPEDQSRTQPRPPRY